MPVGHSILDRSVKGATGMIARVRTFPTMLVLLAAAPLDSPAGVPTGRAEAIVTENFDRGPANWEGVNSRSTHFAPKPAAQDFGYSAASHHAGGQPGEVGGRINPAGEAAYYGYRLPKPLTLDDPIAASGKIVVPRGPGH